MKIKHALFAAAVALAPQVAFAFSPIEQDSLMQDLSCWVKDQVVRGNVVLDDELKRTLVSLIGLNGDKGLIRLATEAATTTDAQLAQARTIALPHYETGTTLVPGDWINPYIFWYAARSGEAKNKEDLHRLKLILIKLIEHDYTFLLDETEPKKPAKEWALDIIAIATEPTFKAQFAQKKEALITAMRRTAA